MGKKYSIISIIIIGLGVSFSLDTQNPIFQHIRTADPSVHLWQDGRVWLYTSHNVTKEYNEMDGYHAFFSSDLVSWADHGEILHSRDISWGVPGFMWAPTAACLNGKYYFSYNAKKSGGDYGMGDNPYGPFEYKGALLKDVVQDHHSIIEYKNQWYLFYHWQGWNGGGKTQRNVTVEFLQYNEDGTIKPIHPT